MIYPATGPRYPKASKCDIRNAHSNCVPRTGEPFFKKKITGTIQSIWQYKRDQEQKFNVEVQKSSFNAVEKHWSSKATIF